MASRLSGWPVRVGKTGASGTPGALGEPRPQGCGHRLGERRDSLLAPLPETVDVRTAGEMQVHAPQAGEFRDAQSRLDREREERVIAAAGPRGAVGRGEQGVDFDIGEEGHEPARAALRRDREHAGNNGRLLGMLQRGVAEQGVNGRQPRVAGAPQCLPDHVRGAPGTAR